MFLMFGDRSSACRYFRQAALTAVPEEQNNFAIEQPAVSSSVCDVLSQARFKRELFVSLLKLRQIYMCMHEHQLNWSEFNSSRLS